eukprot:PhM_4_TR14255/c1_g1_i5/m.8668
MRQVPKKCWVLLVAFKVPTRDEVLDSLLDEFGLRLEHTRQLVHDLAHEHLVLELPARLHHAHGAGVHHVAAVVADDGGDGARLFRGGGRGDLELAHLVRVRVVEGEVVRVLDALGLAGVAVGVHLVQHAVGAVEVHGRNVRLKLVGLSSDLLRDLRDLDAGVALDKDQDARLEHVRRHLLGARREGHLHAGRAQSVHPAQHARGVARRRLLVEAVEDVDARLQRVWHSDLVRLELRPVPRRQHLRREVARHVHVVLGGVGNELGLQVLAGLAVLEHALEVVCVALAHLALQLLQHRALQILVGVRLQQTLRQTRLVQLLEHVLLDQVREEARALLHHDGLVLRRRHAQVSVALHERVHELAQQLRLRGLARLLLAGLVLHRLHQLLVEEVLVGLLQRDGELLGVAEVLRRELRELVVQREALRNVPLERAHVAARVEL